MKTDARVRYTKMVLREALLDAMRDKNVQAITVKEVCDAAGVNRATFYKHYRDCYDLLDQIEGEMIEEFRVSLGSVDTLDFRCMIESIFDVLEKNDDLCRLLIVRQADGNMLKKMIDIAREKSLLSWRAQLSRATEQELTLLFTCLSQGFLQVVMENYYRLDRAELIGFFNRTAKSCLAPYI